jgi:hypothetical protein
VTEAPRCVSRTSRLTSSSRFELNGFYGFQLGFREKLEKKVGVISKMDVSQGEGVIVKLESTVV